jgi:hypothetical protein
MRGRLAAILFAVASVVVVGCGTQSTGTPVACREGTGVYERALAAAPGPVKLRGETSISECLVANQSGGELAAVGTAMVGTATRLNSAARAEPSGEAPLRLGYLLGAAERGAAATDGIHAELIRRLAVAARYSPDGRPLPPAFTRTYREGFDAGEARG